MFKRWEKVEVWNNEESHRTRIFICVIPGSTTPYVCVSSSDEISYENGDKFKTGYWKNIKKLTK